jgi:hypothetical protein
VTCKALRVWPWTCFNSGFSTFPKPGVLTSERVSSWEGHSGQNVIINPYRIANPMTYRILDWKYITSHLSSNNPKLCLRQSVGLFQLSWGDMYFSIQDSVSHGIAPIQDSVSHEITPFLMSYSYKPKTTVSKVSWIQNEFMRSSFLPKFQPKITEISALEVY